MKNKILTLNSIIIPLAMIISLAMISMQKTADAETVNQTFYYIEAAKVDRVEVLREFFEKYDSELANNAETFVEVADEYGIDYKLLPSISCMESTCAKFLIEGSYNPFGWGIYGNNVIRFKSYDDAIETVAKGLSENYFSIGFNSAEKIAPIYTPPNHVKWLQGVRFFEKKIQEIEVSQLTSSL